MTRRRRLLVACLLGLAVAVLGVAALVWRPTIAPIPPPARGAFAVALIERGARLAAVGNCSGCHSAADRPPYAGGVPIATPFGTVYGSNLTPDERTGVGNWSAAAFSRAMRSGVDRAGRHLYPAFPYDHYAGSADDDLRALYAFVMTRTPVDAETPAPALRFPFGFRPLVAGWKLLFVDGRPWQPDPARDAEWNRGAYLTRTLGHCGGCHTPRNALGAERRARAFDGGEADGWYAPPLNAASPSPLPWNVEQMTEYLRSGLTNDHAIAGGPMQRVVAQLAQAEPADVRAIAVYVVSLIGAPTAAAAARAEASRRRAGQPLAVAPPGVSTAGAPSGALVGTAPAASGGASAGPLPLAPIAAGDGDGDITAARSAAASAVAAPSAPPADADPDAAAMRLGAAVYAGACASCHDLGRRLSSASGLQLPLAIAVHDPDPRSLLRIVRDGIAPADGEPGRWMPAFGRSLTDEQLTALAAWLRRRAAGAPAWPDLARAVEESRS